MTSRRKDSFVATLAQDRLAQAPRPDPASAPEDALRAMLSTLIHEMLEREFTEYVGARRFERTTERRGLCNGHRRRRFLTRVGSLELRVPRDRAGRFQPTLFARYQRSEQALVLAMVEMYLKGGSRPARGARSSSSSAARRSRPPR